MRVSIITVTYNSASTIEDTLQSVSRQTYADIEHIVVDGASKDGTVEIIKRYEEGIARWISEPDSGIYDAMNKGIEMASGEIIGILNSDDLYAYDRVIEDIVALFQEKNPKVVFADLWYVKPNDLDYVVRRFSSQSFRPDLMAYGIAPAHPTCFVHKSVFEEYGSYKTDYNISADFEFLVRIFKDRKVPYHYFPKVLIKMRMGGISTRNWQSLLMSNTEMLRACRENNLPSSMFRILLKYPRKILGFVRK